MREVSRRESDASVTASMESGKSDASVRARTEGRNPMHDLTLRPSA